MPAEFTNDQLVACAKREGAMRKSVYLKREGVTGIEQLSPKMQEEYRMMWAIVAQLAALPELLARYQSAKNAYAKTSYELEVWQRYTNRDIEGQVEEYLKENPFTAAGQ
jgi:hypothetical protein